jgi:hypothetical protein
MQVEQSEALCGFDGVARTSLVAMTRGHGLAISAKWSSADDLWHFAKICRVANVMRPYLEAIG